MIAFFDVLMDWINKRPENLSPRQWLNARPEKADASAYHCNNSTQCKRLRLGVGALKMSK